MNDTNYKFLLEKLGKSYMQNKMNKEKASQEKLFLYEKIKNIMIN